jgi:hypothetical protein
MIAYHEMNIQCNPLTLSLYVDQFNGTEREACGIFRHCCATQGKLPAAHHAILYQLGCSGQVLNGRAPSVFRGRSFVILSERTSWLRQTAPAWQRKKEKACALKIPFRKGISVRSRLNFLRRYAPRAYM